MTTIRRRLVEQVEVEEEEAVGGVSAGIPDRVKEGTG